ncbi:MAG: 50S ribosomal protein L3 [Parcubacteria group bacterium GW2011_GWA2_45_30]|nr:MAG: 50S ribosomal protein L3 [Parcubacteria group bacterium GW2011_GWA2_45_30]
MFIMKFVLGEKIGMSQIFDKDGNVVPVTLVRTTPNVVLQIKTKEKDKYEAVQVGFGERKAKNIKKPQQGLFKNLGNFRYVREFRLNRDPIPVETGIGSLLRADLFKEGDKVKVSGVSKGKGFQGVMKRHGLAGRMGSDRVTVRNLKIAKVDLENNMLAIKGAIPGRRGTLVEIRG